MSSSQTRRRADDPANASTRGSSSDTLSRFASDVGESLPPASYGGGADDGDEHLRHRSPQGSFSTLTHSSIDFDGGDNDDDGAGGPTTMMTSTTTRGAGGGGGGSSNVDEEYVRLKLALAQARARTDSRRLRARQLVEERDALLDEIDKAKSDATDRKALAEETVAVTDQLRQCAEEVTKERDQLQLDAERLLSERDDLRRRLREAMATDGGSGNYDGAEGGDSGAGSGTVEA